MSLHAYEPDPEPSGRGRAYAAQEEAGKKYQAALLAGAPAAELSTLRAADEAAWKEYRAWVHADAEAAIAGCFD